MATTLCTGNAVSALENLPLRNFLRSHSTEFLSGLLALKSPVTPETFG